MKVRILYDGFYSHFVGDKSWAQYRSAGDVLEYPDWYAESLIDSGLAVEIPVIEEGNVIKELPEPVVRPERKAHTPRRRRSTR